MYDDVIYKGRYVWNRYKAEENLKKHGVAFEKAAGVFEDVFAIVEYDIENSTSEDRYNITGSAGILVTVSFTMRDQMTRIISARKMSGEELRLYYESVRRNIGD